MPLATPPMTPRTPAELAEDICRLTAERDAQAQEIERLRGLLIEADNYRTRHFGVSCSQCGGVSIHADNCELLAALTGDKS